MTEHHCEGIDRFPDHLHLYFSAPDWVFCIGDSVGRRLSTTVTHCPFCGERLEIPEHPVSIPALPSDWRYLDEVLMALQRQYANNGEINAARHPRLMAWLERLRPIVDTPSKQRPEQSRRPVAVTAPHDRWYLCGTAIALALQQDNGWTFDQSQELRHLYDQIIIAMNGPHSKP